MTTISPRCGSETPETQQHRLWSYKAVLGYLVPVVHLLEVLLGFSDLCETLQRRDWFLRVSRAILPRR
jgi:hypothetical protein